MRRLVVLMSLGLAALLYAENYLRVQRTGAQPGEWPVSVRGDFFLEFLYTPGEKPSERAEAGVPLASLRFGERELCLVQGRELLVLREGGRMLASFPLYHAGAFPKHLAKADIHRIVLQRASGRLSAFVDGYALEGTGSAADFAAPLTHVTLHPGSSQVRLSSGSIPQADIRTRYLAYCAGKRVSRRIPNPAAAVPCMRTVPDGTPLPTELQLRNNLPRQLNQWEPKPVRLQTARDGNTLHFSWQVDTGKPATAQKMGGRDKGLWNVECVELFLLPPGEKTPYQIIVSAAGELYDAHGADTTWNGDIAVTARVTPTGWEGTLTVAAGRDGLPALKGGEAWGMDFFSSSTWRAWSPAGQYHDTRRYGTLTFPDTAPVVRLEHPADGMLGGELVSPVEQTVVVVLEHYASGEIEPVRTERTYRLEAGKPCRISLPDATGTPEDGDDTLVIRSAAGEIFFHHSFARAGK